MSFRINTNTQSAFSLTALNKTSNEIGMRQMRLATGSRINNAGDDSAGFTIANKLMAKTRGQAQALSNIGDAKSMLSVAEGSLGATMDILQTMKEKAVQAGNSSMGAEERAAIQSQVEALTSEVSDILSGAEFNGTKLFSDSEATNLSFQVGDASGDTFGATVSQLGSGTLGLTATTAVEAVDAVEASDAVDAVDATATAGGTNADTISGAVFTGDADATASYRIFEYDNSGSGGSANELKLQKDDGTGTFADVVGYETLADDTDVTDGDFAFTIDTVANGNVFSIAGTAAIDAIDAVEAQDAVEAVEVGDLLLDLTTDAGVATALTTIDAAIASVNSTASKLGDVQNRLDFKAQNLETSMNNYDAARSRIADADFAKEQMEIVKLQILQQTGSAMFAQANAAPQSVLSFF